MREQGAVLGRGVGEKIEFFVQAVLSLKPTAVASVASRGAARRGAGGYAAETCTPPQKRRKKKASFTNVPRQKQKMAFGKR